MPLRILLLLGLLLGAAASHAQSAPSAAPVPSSTATPQSIALFNGRDLTGWYSFLEHHGRDRDPNRNFQVREGVIHILGQDFGYIATHASYENYRLVVEFKWGERQFAPRATGKRDSGILYHFAESEPDKVWPRSLECQVQETDCGDIWCIGTEVESPNKHEQAWGMKHIIRTENFERPHGEWNTIEVVARGDAIEHYVNGRLVNSGTRATVRRGKILLQSEGAEVFYRKVVLTPL